VAQLQQPKFVYMGGKLRLWHEAALHVGCEAVIRGLNVFEGVKGYWQQDGRFAFIMLRRHFERLRRADVDGGVEIGQIAFDPHAKLLENASLDR